jgi:hypothetical protein
MTSRPDPDCAAAPPALGWTRRVLRQQLDALSRLADVALRLLETALPVTTPVEDSSALDAFWTRIRGVEKALRLQQRVVWAQRLIDALCAKLTAELEALDKGQAPASLAAVSPLSDKAAPDPTETAEPTDRPDPRERPERERPERFGFESRGSDRALAKILERPTAEIIALICRELGLPEDWPRLAEDGWADEAARGDWAGRSSAPEPRSSPDPLRICAAPS